VLFCPIFIERKIQIFTTFEAPNIEIFLLNRFVENKEILGVPKFDEKSIFEAKKSIEVDKQDALVA